MALTKRERKLIEEALDKLARFDDPDDERCATPPDVRRAARKNRYLMTWVAGPLEAVLNKTDW